MQLLILPSHRVLLYQASKNSLQLMPFKCEDYSLFSHYIALHHYKSIFIYHTNDMDSPIIEENYLKKVETSQLSAGLKDGTFQCISSDKFGDMNRINFSLSEGHLAVKKGYLNSNLGIPKYLKTFSFKDKRYYLLGDEEKRIKVYNAKGPHELMTVWHMLNSHSVDIFKIEGQDERIVILTKFFDKNTLKEDVNLHWIYTSELEQEEYPGRLIPKMSSYDHKTCKYFSALKTPSSIVLIFLYEERIDYEVFTWKEDSIKSNSIGTVSINKGSWDYLHGISLLESKGILIAYGSQVQVSAPLVGDAEEWLIKPNVALNQYENFTVINI